MILIIDYDTHEASIGNMLSSICLINVRNLNQRLCNDVRFCLCYFSVASVAHRVQKPNCYYSLLGSIILKVSTLKSVLKPFSLFFECTAGVSLICLLTHKHKHHKPIYEDLILLAQLHISLVSLFPNPNEVVCCFAIQWS